MSFYLVEANLKEGNAGELLDKINNKAFVNLKPFGEALTESLENARYDPENDRVLWEEEDYCSPPLKQERKQVLDKYFDDITVEEVNKGKGWEKIVDLPKVWEAHPIF